MEDYPIKKDSLEREQNEPKRKNLRNNLLGAIVTGVLATALLLYSGKKCSTFNPQELSRDNCLGYIYERPNGRTVITPGFSGGDANKDGRYEALSYMGNPLTPGSEAWLYAQNRLNDTVSCILKEK